MRVDTVKTYRIAVSDLKKLMGIPQEEIVQTIHGGPVMPTGVAEIVTVTRCEEVPVT